MAYSDCRSHIETVLAAISITSPIAASIVRVYTTLPEALEDTPCFVAYGSAGRTNWSVGGASTDGMEEHSETFGVVVHDADYAQAGAIVEAFRRATLAAFQDDQGLGGHGVISEFKWDERIPFAYNNRNYVAQDFHITFVVTET